MWLANLSELGPNCIRCSFAISSFKLSISVLFERISAYRSAASACFSITRAFNASESRAFRSGNSALAAVIDDHNDTTAGQHRSQFEGIFQSRWVIFLKRHFWRVGAQWPAPVDAF